VLWRRTMGYGCGVLVAPMRTESPSWPPDGLYRNVSLCIIQFTDYYIFFYHIVGVGMHIERTL
jgi:hypothetical protein